MATFEGTRSPKCCPWTNRGYLTFPYTPPWPRSDAREAYTRAYPNRWTTPAAAHEPVGVYRNPWFMTYANAEKRWKHADE